MKYFPAALVAYGASILSATAGPVARRYEPSIERAGLANTDKHSGYRPFAASHLRASEIRGTSNDVVPGREYGLRDSEHFYWGSADAAQANMTVFTHHDNVKVLSLERFKDAVTEVSCSSTSIELTLEKEIKFDALQAAWAWVNRAEQNYIVFVTEDCPDFEHEEAGRQAWHVANAAFDDAKNTATLDVSPVNWEGAFPRWHLHVSSTPLGFSGMGDDHKKRDIGKGAIDFTHDFSTQNPIPISSTEGAPTIACKPCGTFGLLNYDFDLTHDGLDISGSATLTPAGLGAEITASLAIDAEIATSIPRLTQNLFQLPALEGIHIGSWVNIGPSVYVDLIAGVDQASAHAALAAGLTMHIPDDSKAVLSLDQDDSTWQGWTPTFETTLTQPDLDAAVSVAATAGLQVRAEFDVQVKLPKLLSGDKGFAAGLILDAPTIAFAAEAKLDKGACGSEGATAGVDVDLGIGAELAAFAGMGKPADLPNRKDIVSVGTPLWSTCMPVTDAAAASSTSASGESTTTSSSDALTTSSVAGGSSTSSAPGDSITSAASDASTTSSASDASTVSSAPDDSAISSASGASTTSSSSDTPNTNAATDASTTTSASSTVVETIGPSSTASTTSSSPEASTTSSISAASTSSSVETTEHSSTNVSPTSTSSEESTVSSTSASTISTSASSPSPSSSTTLSSSEAALSSSPVDSTASVSSSSPNSTTTSPASTTMSSAPATSTASSSSAASTVSSSSSASSSVSSSSSAASTTTSSPAPTTSSTLMTSTTSAR